MNQVKRDLVEICQDFIEVAENLYENHKITYEEYVEMTKLKFEYIQRTLSVMH